MAGFTPYPADNKINWGIIATGNIAHCLAHDIALSPGSQVQAVASRRLPSAQQFAEQYGVPEYYGDYGSLLSSPKVDLVYIATPHPMHFNLVVDALNAGKHVVCEKPMTLNFKQAQVCIDLAKVKKRFLLEAVWMRFFPAYTQVKRWLANGAIGTPQWLDVSFSIDVPFNPSHRLYSPELGGGALLDLGIYPISLATMLFGYPQQVTGTASIGNTGVDEANQLQFSYADGFQAQLSSSMRYSKPITAAILGSEGRIDIHENFLCPWKISLSRHDGHHSVKQYPFNSKGYTFQIAAAEQSLKQGALETLQMPWQDTLATMAIMDKLRQQWGIRYPAEQADNLIEASN